jgi:hypothetical protein
VHRIGKKGYGPLNPPERGEDRNRADWSWWDTAGGRTIYAGETALAAFVEVLAYIRENLPKTPMGDLFDQDDLGPDEAGISFAEIVRREMPSPEMRDSVTKGWRDERRHYELRLPTDAWLVDTLIAPRAYAE